MPQSLTRYRLQCSRIGTCSIAPDVVGYWPSLADAYAELCEKGLRPFSGSFRDNTNGRFYGLQPVLFSDLLKDTTKQETRHDDHN